MLDSIRELLGVGAKEQTPPSSEQIEAAISAAEAELDECRTRLADLVARHPDVLLFASEAEIKKHEVLEQEAGHAVERLELALPRLKQRLEETLEADAAAARDVEIEAARATVPADVKRLRELDKIFKRAARLLAELQVNHEQRDRARVAGRKAGSVPEIADPNAEIRPGNSPVFETAVLPRVTAQSQGWKCPGFSVPEEPYNGPLHSLPARRAGMYDEAGNPAGSDRVQRRHVDHFVR